MSRRLKYYIGYEKDGELTPLSILDDNYQLIGDTLPEVINYTSSFNNVVELTNAILNGPVENSIPENCNFVYLEETVNSSKPYRKVLDSDYICYSDDKTYSNPESQRVYLFNYKFDLDLIEKIYALVIRTNIDVDQLKSFYTYEEALVDSDERLIEVFRRVKKILKNGDCFLLNNIDQIYNEILYANKIGIDNYLNDNDRIDIDHILDRFYKFFTIKKDKQKNFRYDPNSGSYLRDPRIMGYLNILLAKDSKDRYSKYVQELYEKQEEDFVDAYNEYSKKL